MGRGLRGLMLGRMGMRPLEKRAGRLAAQGEVQSPVPSLTESVGYPGLRVDLGRFEGVLEGRGSLEDGRHWWNLI